MTVVAATGDSLEFDAVGATLERTLLGKAAVGSRLNLERSLRVGQPVDGHLVTGHVDGVGTVRSRRPREGAVFFAIQAPPEMGPQIVPRGSVAVDGVSLTVAGTKRSRVHGFYRSLHPREHRVRRLPGGNPGTSGDRRARQVRAGRAGRESGFEKFIVQGYGDDS